MKLALKIDVGTYRGTREGVPRLAELLTRHGAGATFLFSMGPDHTGRAINRLVRSRFPGKSSRTSALDHYGCKALLYGTLLPAPDIGRRCAATMRAVRDAGFDVGIHAWNHVKWQDGVTIADAEWTRGEMQRAGDRFEQIFGESARAHGAVGWQMNLHAHRLSQQMGFDYCSDTRGYWPFVPVCNAEIIACPQLPTTLPTLDELIGVDGLTPDNVADFVLELSSVEARAGHIFTLRAELEGMKLAPTFERMLEGWSRAGHELVSLRDYFAALDVRALPRHSIETGYVPGRSGTLCMQGDEFLAVPGEPLPAPGIYPTIEPT